MPRSKVRACASPDPDDFLCFHLRPSTALVCHGSGAVARRVLGSTVIGGMIAASAIAIFLIPVTFYVIERLFAGAQRKKRRSKSANHLPSQQPATDA